VYLPRTEAELDAPAAAAPVSLRGTETILLVEDDLRVRESTHIILHRNGYHVLDAQDGGEAVAMSESFGAPIHLLLTDVVMPRSSGCDLAERLAPSRPGMKVLYVSGHAAGSIGHHGVFSPGVAFLQKPITPDGLLRKVRSVLAA
jgi:DNA-binding NtrC family response regulator